MGFDVRQYMKDNDIGFASTYYDTKLRELDENVTNYTSTDYNRYKDYYTLKKDIATYEIDQSVYAPNLSNIDDMIENRDEYISKYGKTGYNSLFSIYQSKAAQDYDNVSSIVSYKNTGLSADILKSSTWLTKNLTYDENNIDDMQRYAAGVVPSSFDARSIVNYAEELLKSSDPESISNELSAKYQAEDASWDKVFPDSKEITEDDIIEAIGIINELTGETSVDEYQNNLGVIQFAKDNPEEYSPEIISAISDNLTGKEARELADTIKSNTNGVYSLPEGTPYLDENGETKYATAEDVFYNGANIKPEDLPILQRRKAQEDATEAIISKTQGYYNNLRASLEEVQQTALQDPEFDKYVELGKQSYIPENLYGITIAQQETYEGQKLDAQTIDIANYYAGKGDLQKAKDMLYYGETMSKIDSQENYEIEQAPKYVEEAFRIEDLENIDDPEFEEKAREYMLPLYSGDSSEKMSVVDMPELTLSANQHIDHAHNLTGMTEDQLKVYSYYMVTDKELAYKYAEALARQTGEVLAEKQQEQMDKTAETTIGKILLAGTSIPIKMLSGVTHLGTGIDVLTGDSELPDNPHAWYTQPSRFVSQARNTVTQDMSGVGKFLTQTGLSIADFALSYGLTGGAGGIATTGGKAITTGFMASQAAGMTTYDVLQRGGTKGEAWFTGLATGAVEFATEYIVLGKLDKAIKSISALRASGAPIKEIAKQWAINTFAQSGSEGVEELVSEAAGTMVDIAINGDNSSYERYVKELMDDGVPETEARQQAGFKFFGEDLMLAGLGGALSGGAMGAGVQVGQMITSQSDIQAAEAHIKDLDAKIAETTNENLKKELVEHKEVVQAALGNSAIIEHAQKYIEVNDGTVPATKTGRDSQGSYVTADDVEPNYIYVTKEDVDKGANVSRIEGTAIKHYTINGTDQGDTIVFSETELDDGTINKYKLTMLDIPQESDKATLPTQQTQGELQKPVNTQDVDQLNEQVMNNNFKDTKLRDTIKDALNIKTPLDEQFKQDLTDMTAQYETTDNRTQQKVAKEFVSNNFEQAEKYIKENELLQTAADAAIVSEIVNRYRETGRADEALEMIRQTAIKFSKAGQIVQSAAIWTLNTPEGVVKAVERAIEKANTKLRKNFELSDKAAEKLMNDADAIQSMSLQELGNFFFDVLGRRKIKVTKAIQTEIGKLIDKNDIDTLKDAVVQNLMLEVLDKVPRGIGQKLSTIQAFSHLINPRTAIRNVSANTVFKYQELFADYGAAFFDYLMSLKSGQRTVAVPSLRPSNIKQNFKNSQDLAQESVFEIQTGVKLRDEQGKYELFNSETFTASQNKVLNKIERLLGYELKTPDQYAKGSVEASELRKQLALQGEDVQGKTIDELYEMADDESLRIAKQQALYNTFQDDGLIAGLFSETKRVLNKVGIKEQFGLGDLIIKYTRVPGNLIQRSLDYSPVGALKVLKFLGKKNLTRMQQREIAKTLSRSITGSTVLPLVGYLLTSLGIMVSPDGSDREENFLKDLGIKGRKINITAIGRLLKGESTELQDGDKLLSFDFLETINVPLSLGHELAKAIDNDLSVDEIVSNLGDTFTQEILDMPTMYIVNSIVYESLDPDGQPLLVPFKQAVPGFIPAPLRQYSVATDPYQRERDTFKDNLQYNTPLREDLLPQLDVFGQPVEKDTGVWAFFDPGNTSTYSSPEFTEELLKLSEVDKEVIPTGSPIKKFTLDGTTYVLDETEQNEIMQEYGSYLLSEYEKILSWDISDENKIKALKEAQTKYRALVKKNYVLEKRVSNEL